MASFQVLPVPRLIQRTPEDLTVCERPFDTKRNCDNWNLKTGQAHIPYRHTIRTPSKYDAGSFQPCCKPIDAKQTPETQARRELERMYFPVLNRHGVLMREIEKGLNDLDVAFHDPSVIQTLQEMNEEDLKTVQAKISELVQHCNNVYESMITGINDLARLKERLDSETDPTISALKILNKVVPNPIYDHGVAIQVAENRYVFLLAQVYLELERSGFSIRPDMRRTVITPTQVEQKQTISVLSAAGRFVGSKIKNAAIGIIYTIQSLVSASLRYLRDNIWTLAIGAVFVLGVYLVVPAAATAGAAALTTLGEAVASLLTTFFKGFSMYHWVQAWASFGRIFCTTIMSTSWGLTLLIFLWPLTLRFAILRNFYWIDLFCGMASNIVFKSLGATENIPGVGPFVLKPIVEFFNKIRSTIPNSSDLVKGVLKIIEDAYSSATQGVRDMGRRYPFASNRENREKLAELVVLMDSCIRYIVKYVFLWKAGEMICSAGFRVENFFLQGIMAGWNIFRAGAFAVDVNAQIAGAPLQGINALANAADEAQRQVIMCTKDGGLNCAKDLSWGAVQLIYQGFFRLGSLVGSGVRKIGGLMGNTQEIVKNVETVGNSLTDANKANLADLLFDPNRWLNGAIAAEFQEFVTKNPYTSLGVGLIFISTITAAIKETTTVTTAPLRVSNTFTSSTLMPESIETPHEAYAWAQYEAQNTPLLSPSDEKTRSQILQQRFNETNVIDGRLQTQIRDFDASADGYHPNDVRAKREDAQRIEDWTRTKTYDELRKSVLADRPVYDPYLVGKAEANRRITQREKESENKIKAEIEAKRAEEARQARQKVQQEQERSVSTLTMLLAEKNAIDERLRDALTGSVQGAVRPPSILLPVSTPSPDVQLSPA